MAVSKGKLCEEETDYSEIEVEKKTTTMEDRLSDLPESLQLRILSYLDIKQAIQTSKLSRTWVSLWTCIPTLEINYFSFRKRRKFSKFVNMVLNRRDDDFAKLETLMFTVNDEGAPCDAKILKRVFEYAFSHGVKQLEARIRDLKGKHTWPSGSLSLCDSLTSLKLQKESTPMKCLFLGPRCRILFKNLTVLYLERAIIADVEPFSVFPVLESLTLRYCQLVKEGDKSKTLKVHALRLLDLTISDCSGIICSELRTPKLRYLEYRGDHFPKYEGVNVLETLMIDFTEGFYCDPLSLAKPPEKRLIDDLLSLFSACRNVKSLTLMIGTFALMLYFPDELMKRASPFRELKDLTLDHNDDYCWYIPSWVQPPSSEMWKCVDAYLFKNCRDADFTVVDPMSESCSCC